MREISRRTLNRTTLRRQLLLERAPISALAAIERVVALQAQAVYAPYVGLWSRVRGFAHDDLTRLLLDRSVVRGWLLRSTQHLTASADYAWLRPLVRPAMARARQAAFGRATRDVDLAELAEAARTLLAGRTLTRPQIGRLLAERWPGCDPAALGWSVQALLPIIHEPPNGTWGRGGATPFTLAESWLGGPLATEPDPRALVRRYLAGYGPASVMDVQAWSGLTRLREVVESMPLRTYRAESGATLYDLPEAELADPAEPAPVRFLPEFDNLMVAYADRTRIMTDEHRRRVCVGSQVAATVLVDGMVAGVWTAKGGAVRVEPLEPHGQGAALEQPEEREELMAFLAGQAV
ncbi:AlkZ family DNA glycosylase [Streptosporangiaceae bacterium NEAU-GS5]|nr:AlkZ family DNA glycosylase [Streptosporangiaceae bacterium NEAU-GS5]